MKPFNAFVLSLPILLISTAPIAQAGDWQAIDEKIMNIVDSENNGTENKGKDAWTLTCISLPGSGAEVGYIVGPVTLQPSTDKTTPMDTKSSVEIGPGRQVELLFKFKHSTICEPEFAVTDPSGKNSYHFKVKVTSKREKLERAVMVHEDLDPGTQQPKVKGILLTAFGIHLWAPPTKAGAIPPTSQSAESARTSP